MNILIVGNGFDLSHYLPTKYDHFMDVMGAIEEKDIGGLPPNLQEKKVEEWINLIEKTFNKREKIEPDQNFMSFKELFAHTHDPNFIEKTQEYYLTENINLTKKEVIQLQYRLALNCWYQYFKDHVKEVKTWIDFEQKIEIALRLVSKYIAKIDSIYERYGNIEREIRVLKRSNIDKDDNFVYISEIDIKFLIKIKFLVDNPNYGKVRDSNIVIMSDNRKAFISENWFNVENNSNYGLSKEKYINF